MTNHMGKTLCLLSAAVLSAGWCVGEWRARSVDAAMRDRLLRQAVHVAGTLSPQMVRELSFSAADKGMLAFEFIGSQLTALGKCFPHRGIYTMALRDGLLVFGPEDYAEGDPMASPPGTVYEKPAADDLGVFTRGQPVVFGPATDEYGTFVCALAPVCDPDSGTVLMAVGIDTLANDWKAIVDASRWQCLLGSLIVVMVLLGGMGVRTYWTRYRRTKNPGRDEWAAGSPRRRMALLAVGRHTDGSLLLMGMGVLAVAFLVVVLGETWRWTRVHIDATADQQTRLAVEFNRALRDYVGKYVRPEMERRVEKGEFIPEAMSTSFVARSVFDRVREAFPATILRFPSTNPRNPANRATPSEESLIQYFEQHPQSDAWSGVMEFSEQGEKYFVWALPRRFEAGCLQCHGRPEEAPASLLERYGPVAGFGRSVGGVSLDLAAVPVSTAYAKAGARVWRHMLTALILCVLFLGGIVFLIRADAIQRRRSEAELRESLSLLEATLESTADGILVVDRAGRIKSFNSQFTQMWRIPAAVLESRDDNAALAAVLNRLKEPDSFLSKVRELYDHPDMESSGILEFVDGRVIDRYSKPQMLGDQVVGRVWSFRNITEKHAAEQKQAALLRQVAEINEELTHFAYVVSHDLKAPLRGIKLITEWLCEDYGDKLGDEAKEQLDLLQSRVARMHNLIDGVLQYSRVGRIKEETEKTDLNTLIPSIIDGIAPPEHIHIAVEPGLPVIECEKTRITQVFQNLLSNAVKFMDKPVGEVHVGCIEDGESWQFSVADNGPGVEEKYFDRVFKLFQTLAPRDEFESTGVGLALVKKIVEMYGGRIWVESEVGQGCTFFFTLPKHNERTMDEKYETCVVG